MLNNELQDSYSYSMWWRAGITDIFVNFVNTFYIPDNDNVIL